MMNKKAFQKIGKGLKSAASKALAVAPLAAVTVQRTAHATSVVSQINSLNSFVLSIIQAAGVIVTAWGIFEFANGYQSHDGTQQTSALKRIIAGLIMVGAGTLMSMLGVSVS
ncbi:MAG: hypothetical protein LIP11_08245 [Clostridiales bacterium]|nr:hypothetical protein [Clostridiales bacterium]